MHREAAGGSSSHRRTRRRPIKRDSSPSSVLAAEYSEKAGAYDRLWSPVIKPMALPLIPALPLADARYVLDAGSGTGAFLPELQAAAPGARLVAIDRAHGMLKARSIPDVVAAAMDLESIAFSSSIFDVAASIFVLFHLPDPLRGLREIRRALRPGGSLGVATWGVDPGLPGLMFWKEELDRAGAPPDPRDPIVMQQGRMDTPAKLRALVAEAGFTAIEIWSEVFEWQGTMDAVLAIQTTCGLPMRRLAGLSADAREACEARVRRALEGLSQSDLIYRPEVLFCVAS